MRSLELGRRSSYDVSGRSEIGQRLRELELLKLPEMNGEYFVQDRPKLPALDEPEKMRTPEGPVPLPSSPPTPTPVESTTPNAGAGQSKIFAEFAIRGQQITDKYGPQFNRMAAVKVLGVEEWDRVEKAYEAAKANLENNLKKLDFPELKEVDAVFKDMKVIVESNGGLPEQDAATIKLFHDRLHALMGKYVKKSDKKEDTDRFPIPARGYTSTNLKHLELRVKTEIAETLWRKMNFEFGSAIGAYGDKGSTQITFKAGTEEEERKAILEIPDVVAKRDRAIERCRPILMVGERYTLMPSYIDAIFGPGFKARMNEAFPQHESLDATIRAEVEYLKTKREYFEKVELVETRRDALEAAWLDPGSPHFIPAMKKLKDEHQKEFQEALDELNKALSERK